MKPLDSFLGRLADMWPIVLLLLCNVPLLLGTPSTALVFDWGKFIHGEWWRLLTYSFAHVSLYHWMLDGSAFVILWWMWEESSRARRGLLLGCCSMGSLLGALAWSEGIWNHGLCGLSGVAHGLMIVLAIEQLALQPTGRRDRWPSVLVLVLVCGKSLVEAWTGNIMFSSLHPGELGVPIAACHLGGVLGGAAGVWICRTLPRLGCIHEVRARPCVVE